MLTVIDTNIAIIIVALLIGLVTGWWMFRHRPAGRSRTEARRAEGESPYVARSDRPYLDQERPVPSPLPAGVDGSQGDGIADEYAAAATDVAGHVLGVEAHRELPGADASDDLQSLKGVGPKFVIRLAELGIVRFEQLAALSDNEAAILDEQLGPFRGRLARDRVIEQAAFLARGDIEGFEAIFGKLGSSS